MEYQKELEIATLAVIEAGEILRRYFQKKNYNIKYKSKSGKGNPVTDADIESNEILKDKIISNFPNDRWLSEETIDDKTRLKKQRVWVVDPLDGTNDFLKGIPEFSISISLVIQKKPVLGIAHNPITGELYYGVSGNGSFLKNLKTNELKKLHISQNHKKSMKESSIIVSRKEIREVEKIRELAEKFGEIKLRESIAYKIVSVASEWADATVSVFSKSEWDLAGAHIITEEAGLKITDSLGREILYNDENIRKNGVIVANEFLHSEILKILSNK